MNIEQATHNSGTSEFLNFSDALHHLRWGRKIARRSWPAGSFLKAIYNTGATYIIRGDSIGRISGPTSVSGEEIMAEDWFVVGDDG